MESVTYHCANCGAALRYDGKENGWVCDHCGSSFMLSELEQNKRDQKQVAYHLEENIDPQTLEHAKVYQCPNCGAQIVTDEETAAGFCMFCNSPTIFAEKLEGELKPYRILPFETTKEDAKAAFLKMCKGKKLLPKGYFNEQRLEKITGIYVPFWLFDTQAAFDYHAVGERSTTWTDANFIHTKTDFYSICREGKMDFAGVPIDASRNMDDRMMDALEPFHMEKAVDFHMGYLSGFFAEKYTFLPKDLFERMTNRIKFGTQRRVEETLPPYQAVRNKNCQIQFSSDRQRYLLFPVWLLQSNYQGKTYTFAMNGQTGKIVGTLPCGKAQMAKWFFILFLISFVLIFPALLWIGGLLG